MPADPLPAQDAVLWCAQDPRAPLVIGAVCRFERAPLVDRRGTLRHDDLRRHVASRLHLVPRFRRRLALGPGGWGRPLWVDDTGFDLDHHVRVGVLPGRGGKQALQAFVGDRLAEPLDPGRPLWELWIVDRAAPGQVAVLLKASHVMADGLALLGFALALLDLDPEAPPVDAPPWRPLPAPSGAGLLAADLADQARTLARGARGAVLAALRPDRLVPELADLGRAAAAMLRTAPRLPVTAPVGPRRGFLALQLPLDDVRAVKATAGVTFNDVALTITTLALHRYLGRQDPDGSGTRPRVLVPVSTHGTDPGGEIENRFSYLVVDLPAADVAPAECLAHVHADLVRAKASGQVELGALLFSLAGAVPGGVLDRVAPAVLRRQPFVNLAVSDLPGSPDPLHLLGARMLELTPFITCTANIALIIGVLTYVDTLAVGITVDPDVVRDVEGLGRDLRWATRRLTRAVA